MSRMTASYNLKRCRGVKISRTIAMNSSQRFLLLLILTSSLLAHHLRAQDISGFIDPQSHVDALNNISALMSLTDENQSNISAPANIDTLFMRSVISFQFRHAVELLEQGANIEFRGWYQGQTALLFASQYNQCDSLFYELLRRGANPFARDIRGTTTLHYAAKCGNIRKLFTLVNYGINRNVRDNESLTPLHYAASDNNIQAVLYFRQIGVDIEAQDTAGHTPLWYAWQSRPFFPYIYIEGPDYYHREGMKLWGAQECFEALINAKADISAIPWKGVDPILRLAEYDNPDLIELALSNGADLIDTSAAFTPLHIAARFNCFQNIEFLLNAGIPPDVKDGVGDTPLIVACRRGSYDVVKLLVEAGADVNYLPPPTPQPEFCIAGIRPIVQFRPLYWAMNANRPDIVIYLLQNGADPNNVDNGADPLLLTAVSRQDTTLVRELISYSANPNAQNIYGYSPLEQALRLGNLRIAKILYRAGSSFDIHTTKKIHPDPFSGLPLLHRMAAQQNEEAVRWLLENGVDPNELDYVGQTAAFHAAYYNQVKILEDLVKYGINLNMANKNNETGLHIIARRGSEEAMFFLLKQGVNPNAVSKEGLPPLGDLCLYKSEAQDSVSLAVWRDKAARMATELISAGASIEILCRGRHLLEWAFEKGNKPLAEVALKNGADPIKLDKHKSSYLHRLWRSGEGWMVSLLIRYGADPNAIDQVGDTPLVVAANQGRYIAPDITYFSALLKGGASINYQNPKGMTALYYAIDWLNEELTEWLLENGASPDLVEEKGLYPLYGAICARDVHVAELLIKAGANADRAFPRYKNMTYLHIATTSNFFDIVRLLLKHGADPNKRDDNGNTPLHIAASSRYPNEGGWCVEALLQASADVNARNNAGLTPLDVAKINGCDQIRELLTNASAR